MNKTLLKSYLDTFYQCDINKKLYAIGQNFDASLPFIYQSATWITAYNPRSQKLSDYSNHDRHLALMKFLDEISCEYVIGTAGIENPQWREIGFWCFDLPFQTSLQIARDFEQNAFLWANPKIHLILP